LYPKFFSCINTYFLHCLCLHFATNHSNTSILPIIFNNQFFFSIDNYSSFLIKFKPYPNNFLYDLYIIIERFTMIFHSYNYYLITWTKKKHNLDRIWYTHCYLKNCRCKQFIYTWNDNKHLLIRNNVWCTPLENELVQRYDNQFLEHQKKVDNCFTTIACTLGLLFVVFIIYVMVVTKPNVQRHNINV
jgi:hypothetical protein